MGVGGALHFHIVYDLYHSFFCFRFFRMEEIKQRDYSHTDSKQNTNYFNLFSLRSSLNIQDYSPPDTSPDHPDIFQ